MAPRVRPRGPAGLGRDRVVEKAVEEQLDAEVVDRAAEVDGRLPAGAHRRQVEGMAGPVEHRQLLGDLRVGVVVQLRPHGRILQRNHLHGRLIGAAGHPLKQMDLARAPVEHAAKPRAVAERPDDRGRLQPEHVFQFVQQVDRIARGPIALVHEREDRDAPPPAHLEELAGLGLDALGRVDHHQHGVHGGEDPVGVLGEVLVPRGVEEVHRIARVVELQDGRADRDAALALQLHPVRGGRPLVFPVLDGAGQVDRVPVEQKLLGQGRLAGVRMRDDREGAATGDFSGGRHAKG